MGVGRTHAYTQTQPIHTRGCHKEVARQRRKLRIFRKLPGEIWQLFLPLTLGLGQIRWLICSKLLFLDTDTHTVRVVGNLQQGATNPRGWRLRTKAPHAQTQTLCSALCCLSDALHTIIYFISLESTASHHDGLVGRVVGVLVAYRISVSVSQTTLTRIQTHALAIRRLTRIPVLDRLTVQTRLNTTQTLRSANIRQPAILWLALALSSALSLSPPLSQSLVQMEGRLFGKF